MKQLIAGSIVIAMLTAACANPTPVGGDVDVTIIDETFFLTPEQAQPMSEKCLAIAESIVEGDIDRSVSLGEDLDATLSTIDGSDDIRTIISRLTDRLARFTPASSLVEEIRIDAGDVYGVLADAGATDCAMVLEAVEQFITSPPKDQIVSLDAARALWANNGLATYWMILRFSGDDEANSQVCGIGEVLAQVVDGAVESAYDRFFLCDIPIDGTGPIPLTVDGLFDLAATITDTPKGEVEYDTTLGYPRVLFANTDGKILHASIELTPGIAADRSEAVIEELSRQRAIWAANGLADYTFTVENGCYCPQEWRGPFQVTVVDGAIVSVTREGQDVTEFAAQMDILTVESLFDVIEQNAHADHLEAIYHALGYPTLINIDVSFNTADEERYITTSDLLPTS